MSISIYVASQISTISTECNEMNMMSVTKAVHTNQTHDKVISIPLLSLPLRPSTLTALLRSGFATTGDIMTSVQQAEIGSSEQQQDHGDENNNGTNTMTNGNFSSSGIGHLAEEIGCSVSQSVDYVHEINDALNSVGLPPVTATTTAGRTDGTMDNIHATVLRNTSNIPATAASLLRSKINTHMQSNSNNSSTARQIVSFSQPLDMLLGGGFALSELTEIAGLPGAGKSQLAMQLCVDARLPGQYGGVEGCAVVIDAEGSWSDAGGVDRLWSMASALVDHVKSSALRKMEANEAKEMANGGANTNVLVPTWFTPESILDGIHIFRVHDLASQTCTLYNLPQFLQEQEEKGKPVKILVIDSLAFHYRVASSINSGNKGNFLSTTTSLTRMAAFLQELASEFDLAVVALNHLTNKIDKDRTVAGGMKLVRTTSPSLGESWAHSVTSRLMVDFYHRQPNGVSPGADAMGEVRTCSLVKSPHKPNGTALFMITDKGIRGLPPQFMQQAEEAKRARLN
jgi:RecA/RadA recombinase